MNQDPARGPAQQARHAPENADPFSVTTPPPAPDRTRPAAVVTGGSRGLGRHLVQHLARTHNVAFGWHRSQQQALELAADLAAKGLWAMPLPCDVTDANTMESFAARVNESAGPCQVLIHTPGTFSQQPLCDIEPATWRDELDTTVTGAFHAWRAFAPQLRSHARSRVLFIGDSAAGTLRARPRSTAYHIGKHGLLLLARTIASELQGTGLTCNVVSPGVLPNSIDLDQPGMAVNVTFEELTAVIDFLLRPAADAVSGSHLIASRGWNL